VIDPRVLKDFNYLKNKVVKLLRVEAYDRLDNNVTVCLDPPVAFRLTHGLLEHTCEGWLDPIYDVDPIDPFEPWLAPYRSFWCYGLSYHEKTGRIEESDIDSIQMPDGNWVHYNGVP